LGRESVWTGGHCDRLREEKKEGNGGGNVGYGYGGGEVPIVKGQSSCCAGFRNLIVSSEGGRGWLPLQREGKGFPVKIGEKNTRKPLWGKKRGRFAD